MNKLQSLLDLRQLGPDDVPGQVTDPANVLTDTRLSDDEKRALLASWASDANTVADCPAPRRLPDGSVVPVDHILKSLKTLDGDPHIKATERRRALKRLRYDVGRLWFRPKRRNDDDDDPPPCPAYAAVRPRNGGGGAFAVPEPVAA